MEITLCSVVSIPEGEGRTFDTGGRKIAVFRTRGGRVFATQAECPHRKGPLADGLVGGTTLICPLHALKFDLTTGQALSGECELKTYGTRLTAAGHIVVELGEA